MKFRRNLAPLKFARRAFGWAARYCENTVGRHGEIVTVLPDDAPKGSVVLSYHTDPWIYPECRATHYHTNRWESGLIGDTFVEAGYRLDVVEHNNPHFAPRADTAFAIDLEQNLERYSRLVPAGCVKIHHASTTHWTHWNLAELTRLHAIQQRRGVTLVPRRQIPPNLAHEVSDRAIMVGNAFTAESYAFSEALKSFPFTHYADPMWDTRRMNNILAHFVTAHFDARLKGDSSKLAYLQLVPNGKDGVYAVDRSGTPLASYTYWKGFKRGTAAGLTFEAERAAARRP